MKTTILVATLALLAGAPLAASASTNVPGANSTAVTDGQVTRLQRGDSPAGEQSAQPQLIGPYEVHHGLLPNGIQPNPFTYG
jgi:hypothetical protein